MLACLDVAAAVGLRPTYVRRYTRTARRCTRVSIMSAHYGRIGFMMEAVDDDLVMDGAQRACRALLGRVLLRGSRARGSHRAVSNHSWRHHVLLASLPM